MANKKTNARKGAIKKVAKKVVRKAKVKTATRTKKPTKQKRDKLFFSDKAINELYSENALKMMKKRYLNTWKDGNQETPAEMIKRISHALAEVEKNYGHDNRFIKKTEENFFEILAKHEYTPAGRTVTNVGSPTPLIANCIVLPIFDSMKSIFQTLKDAALLQQAGSGLGFDFSHLRPAYSKTKKSNGLSSGPVSFLKVYNEAFGVIKQQGRHGANMAMMQIDHPDVIDFIRCKQSESDIRNFNISIKVTDEFMKQVTEKPDTQWYCMWNDKKMKPQRVLRAANGSVMGAETIDITAKQLFDEIVENAWNNGEPGIVFIDEVNRTNPLPGLGPIDCSNPCGEQFLHHYDNCNLGSINLAKFVTNKKMDWNRLRFVTKTATRMMDNVIDLFDFPVQQVTDLAQRNRRIGLGIMGFADMLYQLEIPYNSEEGRKMGEKAMRTINEAAHQASQVIAKEKGIFANHDLSIFKKKNVKMRNAALTTVAPTGSISMMLDCSSGIEPVFALAFIKQDKDGQQYPYLNKYFEEAIKNHRIQKPLVEKIKEEIKNTGSIQHMEELPKKLRDIFVVAMDIEAEDHMKMQASFQKHVDNSISKTINFPNSATREQVAEGYITAWKSGCKSCTVYRDGSRNIQILNLGDGKNIKAPTEIGKVTKKEEVPVLNLSIDKGKLARRKRPEIMHGKTYQVKTGYGKLYVTINDDEYGAPFEVFATIGKSGGFYAEVSEGICRLISSSLRAGVKIESIIKDLKGIRGPMPVMTNKGTVLSLSDAIGQVLEEHVTTKEETKMLSENKAVNVNELIMIKSDSERNDGTGIELTSSSTPSIADNGLMPGCPDCGAHLQMAEGCISCRQCGFTRCL
ncbi:MAG: ribonucleoside-diphosphate reductase, adenosylcobalamin-dependent [Candidatus Harrisonbacteria bacterium CG10_big_fil_rev_8_21_14_0_10_42_17]|uniref:Vitamin B12-dependent ribonucleotide reductase n=1 Tax=Candidatus Harrisonbacteria bacterium CG10_big_fil_rev_8_21_14_0_10_42_17 TaxID=1974584 RepID=A0A2M6WI33_9BACT|nr:MAG: ribonucleoside-diphosphate reductase, adenosylcobalamin-dependent [Candidatus Harrisonbacteria bacterium CG10_big_fil_rev_8_21_14_0_10_42_17]